MFTYTIDPKLTDKYASANVYVMFGINTAEEGNFKSSTGAESDKICTNSAVNFATFKIENVTNEITLNATKEAFIFYVGVEYIAVPVTDDMYAEWLFGNVANNTKSLQEEPNDPIVNPVISKKNNIISEPSMTITRHELNKNYPMQGVTSYTGNTPYSSLNLTWTTAAKVSNNHGFYLKTNMSEIGAESYSLTVAWRGNSGNSTINITNTDTNESVVDSVTASNTETTVNEFVNLSAENITIKFTGEAFNYYIGIKYNSANKESVNWGEHDVDSGKYVDSNSQTYGVIRFLQEVSGEDISEYGFYFVNADDGKITISNSNNLADDGFYGDLIGIPEDDTAEYKAKPYVVLNGGSEPIYGEEFGTVVDWNQSVTDYGTQQ